ncbi:hypothetical protein ARZXY2_1543 [Arthrobacter sp. ZXY-2]|nr:hypothetical protein ARZXY2_1543 [Arthrobacter sp. ZXY-2]
MSNHKHSLNITRGPRWPGEIVMASTAKVTILNSVQRVESHANIEIRFICRSELVSP